MHFWPFAWISLDNSYFLGTFLYKRNIFGSPCCTFALCFFLSSPGLLAAQIAMYHDHHLPCLHCHPHSYIRMVQHLIERCLLLRMSRDDCVEALAQHASIRPLITLTVWRELLKENRGFFKAYFQAHSTKPIPYRPFQRASSRFRRRKPWK